MRHDRRLTPIARGAAWLLGLSLLLAPCPALATAHAGCLERAADWANVHPTLLRAIAWVESSGNPSTLNWNSNGSYDVGLMQINSWWYTRGLASIWPRLGDPCVNAAAGSWVLKQCMDEYGYTWDAIGCYNAGSGWSKSPKRRAAAQRYIRKVHNVIARAENRTIMPLTEPSH